MSMQKLKEVPLFLSCSSSSSSLGDPNPIERTNERIHYPARANPSLSFPSLFHSSTMMEITPSVPYIHPISLLLPLFSALVVVEQELRASTTRNTHRDAN